MTRAEGRTREIEQPSGLPRTPLAERAGLVRRTGLAGMPALTRLTGLAASAALSLSGCRLDFELPDDRGPGADANGGVDGGTGGNSGTGADSGTGAGSSMGASSGFGGAGGGLGTSEPNITAVRLVLLDKEPTGLGTEVARLVYLSAEGNFPSQPLDPALVVATDAGSNPELAFDDDEFTWFRLRESEFPGNLQIENAAGLPTPTGAFVDLHQSAERAPSHFRFDASDGTRWWTILSKEDFIWPEPGDETVWQTDQRSFQFPPPSEWQPL